MRVPTAGTTPSGLAWPPVERLAAQPPDARKAWLPGLNTGQLPAGVPRAYMASLLHFGRELRFPGALQGIEADFEKRTSHTLDEFQREGMRILSEGHSPVIAAPTSSGKTLVAEIAIEDALASRRRVFYTAPRKAISNEKYQEFRDRFGARNVGLMTGDVTENPRAPILLMTTEVFRNMVARGEGSNQAFNRLKYVVFDECHFINDPDRGPVWEESAIFARRELPDVQQIHLSATVRNAEEYTKWLNSLNTTGTPAGEFHLVTSDKRPVPLTLQYLTLGLDNTDQSRAKGRSSQANTYVALKARLVPVLNGKGELNEQCRTAFEKVEKLWRKDVIYPAFDPVMAVKALHKADQLPMIGFVFSKKRCTAYADALKDAPDLNLVSPADRKRIDAVIGKYLEVYPFLKASPLLQNLQKGIGYHHADMWPREKELVEALMQRALVKVVFATGTLAEGINVPAKTVMITEYELPREDGKSPITASEFLQMIGRAGRRGMYGMGYAVLAHPLKFDTADEKQAFNAFLGLACSQPARVASQLRLSPSFVLNLRDRLQSTEKMRLLLHQSFKAFQGTAKGQEKAVRDDLDTRLTNTGRFLAASGFVDDKGRLTSLGNLAKGIPWDSGLPVAKAIERGLLDSLEPAYLAGVLSATVMDYTDDRRSLFKLSQEMRPTINSMYQIHNDLLEMGKQHGLNFREYSAVDPGMAETVAAWCKTQNPALLKHNPGQTMQVILRTANLLQHITQLPGASDTLRRNAETARKQLLSGTINDQIRPMRVALPRA